MLNLDYTLFIPLAVFGACAAGVWILLDFFSPKEKRAEDRLDAFNGGRAKYRDERGSGRSKMAQILEKTAVAVSRPLQSTNETETNRVKERLVQAGFRSESAPYFLWGAKVIGLAFGLMIAGGTALLSSSLGTYGLLKLMLPVAFFFFLPDLVLAYLGSQRKQSIFLGLPDALDLMVVCVEAGLGLDQALRKVTEEMRKAFPVIADEFGLCNMHMQMGRARTQVLSDLGARTGVDDLKALASILIQADKFGSSIAQALRVQSESMRTRRKQLAEEKAAKTAVKLIFPLVLFIFPGIFVVLVGPAAITMIREMFPAMQGGG